MSNHINKRHHIYYLFEVLPLLEASQSLLGLLKKSVGKSLLGLLKKSIGKKVRMRVRNIKKMYEERKNETYL